MSSRAARRALLRWAIRMFRREWRQQVLVLALLTLTVAAAVAGSVMAINASGDATGRFGSGGAAVVIEGGGGADATDLTAQVEAAEQRFGTVDVVSHRELPIPGTLRSLDVRDQDPQGVFSGPMLAIVSGRYPASAGEVALTRSAASMLGATVGGTVALEPSATVVGIVENPSRLDDTFALVAPGTIEQPSSLTVLVDKARVAQGRTNTTDAGSGVAFRVETEGGADGAIAVLVLVVSTVALALVALIASAGFLVVAQRHQRQLGLVAALGASVRQVQFVVVANGLIVALCASCFGGALGIAAWFVAAPAVETAAGHRIGRLDVPWAIVVAILVLALVVSTLAAWWPARVAGRQPIVAALAARPARPRPVHRSVLVALLLVTGGLVSIALARATTSHVRPVWLVTGMIAVIVGAVFVTPAAVRSLGPLARRLPFSGRLALRDLARYQARAAAALAAITLGLGIAVGVIVLSAASELPADAGNLSANELLVLVDSPRAPAGPEAIAAETASLDQRASQVVAALGGVLTAVPLDLAYSAALPGGSPDREPATLGIKQSEHSIEDAGLPYVATPEVLALYGIDPAQVDPNVDLLTRRTRPMLLFAPPALGKGGVLERSMGPDFDAPPVSTQVVDLPAWSSAPNSLITETAMQRHGWVAARRAWIVEAPDGFSAAQVAAARAAAANVGLAIETRETQDALASLRSGATAFGGLLALAIVAMTVGLIRGESARDVRTMTATGASGRTRRAVTASTAGALAALGVVLSTITAYAAIVAAYHGDLAKLTPLPVANLLVLGVGLPAVAAAAGWLLAGREPAAFSRQSLD